MRDFCDFNVLDNESVSFAVQSLVYIVEGETDSEGEKERDTEEKVRNWR